MGRGIYINSCLIGLFALYYLFLLFPQKNVLDRYKIYIAPYVHADSEALSGWITCNRRVGIDEFLPCDAMCCTVFVTVILSVCLSICHTRGLCPHGSTYDHDFYGSPIILVSGDITFIPKFEAGHPCEGVE